jgi:5-methylcytosine-specific restriction endonuclease McrA
MSTPEKRAKHAAYMREWKLRHPEYTAYQRAKEREYRENPEFVQRRREQARDWYYRNKERALENVRAWRSANKDRVASFPSRSPERIRLYAIKHNHNRRVWIAGTSAGQVDFDAVVAKANGLCGICREPIDGEYHFDHIVPLARGGKHTTDNLQVAHSLCNRKKWANV